jgi:hypothetical protein
MNYEDFLPFKGWNSPAKQVIKENALRGFTFIRMTPLTRYVVWAKLIRVMVERQRDKRIRAIMEVFPNCHNESQLKHLHATNRPEFDRLFKLASEEFFHKFLMERGGPILARQSVNTLQKRLTEMGQRIEFMEVKVYTHAGPLHDLEQEAELYKEVYNEWLGMFARSLVNTPA